MFRQLRAIRRRYKIARMRSHVPSLRMIALSSTSLYCFSVQQGPVRDRSIQIPWQARRLRLGYYPGHPHPLLQAAEADLRRLRQLHPKVGSVTILPVRCWFSLLHTIKPEYLRLRLYLALSILLSFKPYSFHYSIITLEKFN